MQNRKGLALVLAFVVALSAAGCGQKAAPAEKAPLVKTQQAGSGMDKVIKTTVFLSDMNNFAAMNAVYETFFPAGNCPARSAVEVARLPKDAMEEIKAVAHL